MARPIRAINLREVGARGDGVTNDLNDLLTALDDARAHKVPVYAPAGTYRLTLPENPAQGTKKFAALLPRGVTLYGDGKFATTFHVPQHNVTAFAVEDEVTLRSLGLRGSGHPTWNVPNWKTTPNAAGKLGGLQSGVDSGTNHHVTIDDVLVEDFALHGIKASDGADYWSIRNSLVRRIGDEGIVTLNRSRFHTIENNIIMDCGKNGVGCNGSHIKVVDNTIIRCGNLYGLIGWPSDVHGVLFWNAESVVGGDISHVLVADNTIVKAGGVGIWVEAPSSLRHESARIVNNHVEDSINGIVVGINRGGLVRGNVLYDNMAQGIVVLRGRGLVLEGNQIITPPTSTHSPFAGITIVASGAPAGEPSRVKVLNNVIEGTPRGIYASGGSYHKVVGNDLSGVKWPELGIIMDGGIPGAVYYDNEGFATNVRPAA